MIVDSEMYEHDSYETPPGMIIVGMWCHRCEHFLDPGHEDASCWGTMRAHPIYAPADTPVEWVQAMREQVATLDYHREPISELREQDRRFLNGGGA